MFSLNTPTSSTDPVSRAWSTSPRSRHVKSHRGDARCGLAAVEFALCLPLMLILLFGIWEVGRIVEVTQVMWNAAREAGRQASTGEDDLATIAAALGVYMAQAEPTTMNLSGTLTHVTTTVGNKSTVTVSKAGTQLYTLSFENLTDGTRNDPTTANQTDKFEMTVTMPFNNVRWNVANQITNVTTMTATVDWYSMRDTPIVINPVLPVQ